MQLFVFWGDMQDNTENRQCGIKHSNWEKEEIFLLSCKTKVQKPVWRETNIFMKLSPHKSNEHKQE